MSNSGFGASLTRRDFARMAASAGLWTAVSCAAAEKKPKATSLAPSIAVSGADSLRAHAAATGLLVGCAAVPELLDFSGGGSDLSQDPYTRTVSEQANILVPENALKWSSIRPTATTYDFAQADKLFSFAARYQQKMRGHNLCWHEQLPAWFAATATRENAQSLLTQHIQVVAGRYAGRVHSWDVVNEAIFAPDGRVDGFRKSPWLDLIGPGYVEIAFAAAAKADPQAKLTYNEYDIELDTEEQTGKRALVLLMLRRLHARGIPIHAMGIQSHLQANGPLPGAGLVSFIREVGKMGLEVYITELDVNSHALPGGPELQDGAVASVYQNYLDLVLAEPNVKAVLTWGITDAHTWLNQSKQPWALRPDGARQRPLPFDEQYAPTSAFFALRNALDSAQQSSAPTASTTLPPVSKTGKDEYPPVTVPRASPAPSAMPPMPTPPIL